MTRLAAWMAREAGTLPGPAETGGPCLTDRVQAGSMMGMGVAPRMQHNTAHLPGGWPTAGRAILARELGRFRWR